MRLITAYETTDGKLYKNEKEAHTHQQIIDIQSEIYELVGGNLGTAFANGDGYYQLTQETIDLVHTKVDSLKELAGVPKEYSITSVYCRDNSDVSTIGYLMATIDETTLRRYGQPYYKIYPGRCTSQKDWSQNDEQSTN